MAAATIPADRNYQDDTIRRIVYLLRSEPAVRRVDLTGNDDVIAVQFQDGTRMTVNVTAVVQEQNLHVSHVDGRVPFPRGLWTHAQYRAMEQVTRRPDFDTLLSNMSDVPADGILHLTWRTAWGTGRVADVLPSGRIVDLVPQPLH